MYNLFVIGLLIFWIVIGTSRLKWHPVIVLFFGSIGLMLLLGQSVEEIPVILSKGIGQTFEKIGLLILFGSAIGIVSEQSNATVAVAKGLLRLISKKRPLLLMNVLGYVVSIPVFCDAAFVILSALSKPIAASTRTSTVGMSVALSTGLYATHVLVPPTPGPLAAAANIEFNQIGLLILFGGLLALVLALVGWAFSNVINNQYKSSIPETLNDQLHKVSTPPLFKSILPILLPLLLMTMGAVISNDHMHSVVKQIINVLSQPTMALLVGVICSFSLLDWKLKALNDVVVKSIIQAAPILFITAMGGTLGLVLQQVPITDFIDGTTVPSTWALMIPFVLAALLKTAQGSSTVAIITASSIFYPLMASFDLDNTVGQVLTILSVGVGSMTISHANDSYFWIVSQFGEMDVKTAYKTHTVATLLQGAVGLFIILISSMILL